MQKTLQDGKACMARAITSKLGLSASQHTPDHKLMLQLRDLDFKVELTLRRIILRNVETRIYHGVISNGRNYAVLAKCSEVQGIATVLVGKILSKQDVTRSLVSIM